MTKFVASALALVLVLTLGAFAWAQAETHEFTFQGKVMKVYDESRVLQVKIQRIVPDSAVDAATAAGLKPGHLVYVFLKEDAQVFDQEGKSQKRSPKDDEGWDLIDDDDLRLQLTVVGKRDVTLRGGDMKGAVQAYEITRAQVIKDD